jgi:signal transduction histidine kinase
MATSAPRLCDSPCVAAISGASDRTQARHVEMLDVMAGLLSEVGEGSPPDAFFSRLCEAICRLTSMRRAVLFRYDSRRRRVRAVGAHGMDLDVFADLFVTIDSVPVARAALREDRIQEVVGARDFKVPQHIEELFAGVSIICTPMAAAGRYVGVVLSEREADAAEMDESERHLLWTLGKTIAMASVAREVTASDEQRRQLQQRIALTREIHEGVVQRLFGVSLALSGAATLDAESRRRCAAEVQSALADLSAALKRPLGHAARPTTVGFEEELERVRALYPTLNVRLETGSPSDVPRTLEALAQSVLVEAVRNASKHSRARTVGVALRNDGTTFEMTIRNDGAHVHSGGQGGVGLRLATLDALQYDGVLEYGELEPGAWQVRLVVPNSG